MSLQSQLQSIVEKIDAGKKVFLTSDSGTTLQVLRVIWGGTSPTVVMNDAAGNSSRWTAADWKRLRFHFTRGRGMSVISTPRGDRTLDKIT